MINNRRALVYTLLILWLANTCTSKEESRNSRSSQVLLKNAGLAEHKSIASSKEFSDHRDVSLCQAKNVRNKTKNRSRPISVGLVESENRKFSIDLSERNNFHLDTFYHDFVLEYLKSNNDLKLSNKCFQQWHNLRENLIQSYNDSYLKLSSYWSQQSNNLLSLYFPQEHSFLKIFFLNQFWIVMDEAKMVYSKCKVTSFGLAIF